MAIVPKCFKYVRQKNDSTKTSDKKTYSKSYIIFLDIARDTGMIKEHQLKDDYILITFSDSFLEGLSQPPYTKIHFYLLDEISSNNYRFIIYFIIKQFSNNPKHPYFVNMKIKDLLKVSNISLRTSQTMAAQRLNSYLYIREKYHAISEQITDIADDIKKNKLLKFRLYHFKHISLDAADDEDNDYDCDEE